MHTVLVENPRDVPRTHILWLTNAFNSSSRRFNIPFYPLWILHSNSYIFWYTHTKIIKDKILFLKEKESIQLSKCSRVYTLCSVVCMHIGVEILLEWPKAWDENLMFSYMYPTSFWWLNHSHIILAGPCSVVLFLQGETVKIIYPPMLLPSCLEAFVLSLTEGVNTIKNT